MAKKKASSKKSTLKKTTKKPAAKKAVGAKKTSPKKAAVKKAATKKSITKKSAAKKATGKKPAAAKKPVAAKKTAPKKQTAVTKKPTIAPVIKSTQPAKKVNIAEVLSPLDDRLVVQVSNVEKMTPGGLYIPDTVTNVSGNLEGFVVAVGRGHMNKKGHIKAMDVKPGDRVVFSEYAGAKIKIQNEDLLILRESDVMGVVSK